MSQTNSVTVRDTLRRSDRHGVGLTHSVTLLVIDARNDMIMRPAWRFRTTPRRRWAGIALTFALVGGIGLAIMWLLAAVLRGVGAPGWLVWAPWWVPMAGAVVWALGRPKPGVATEDGDDSWMLMAVRAVMVGLDEPRARPLRAVASVVFGAPIAWGMVIVVILMLVGIA